MNEEKRRAFFTVLSQLKQKVILKWESDQLPKGLPENALALKWLPQDDILANPKTCLFISHCGLSSVNEAKYHGVPILGIPLFAEQIGNANNIVREGWAIQIPYVDVTEPILSQALNEILTNTTYRATVRQKSMLYRDRPTSPMDTAIFWTEYVIRHNGARHMKSDASTQYIWQATSIDVIAFLIVQIIVVWKLLKFLTIKLIKKLYSLLFSKKIKKD